MDNTSEWYKSIMLVPEMNGKVRLCLYPARLNEAQVRSLLKGLTMNSILSRLAGMKHLMLMGAKLGYHKQKLDKNHSI